MSSPKTCVRSSSSSFPPHYILGEGIDDHAIEIDNKLHPYSKKNLDENIIHIFENTLVLGPHWFGKVHEEMAKLFKEDVKAPLCYQNPFVSFHSWVNKHLSRSYPSSEVRNNSVKWSGYIDYIYLSLSLKYATHWTKAGIYDVILMSKHAVNKDENLLAATLCFWNSATNTFEFYVSPMFPTLANMAQIFGFMPHGRPANALGNYHKRENGEGC